MDAKHREKRSIKIVGYAVIVVLLLSALELVSLFFLSTESDFILYRVYNPWMPTKERFDSYAATRDPALGWPKKTDHGTVLTAAGARRSPANDALGAANACVSIYGDSFAYSSGVDDARAWSNILAQRLGCRVDNFGVGGYGVDQAVMRFAQNAHDKADLTILAIYPDDLLRNLNQWRYLITGDTVLEFKPSFRVEGNELVSVPPPDIAYGQLGTFLARPQDFLTNEAYLPNTRFGQITVAFPYSWSAAQLVYRHVSRFSLERIVAGARPQLWNRPRWFAGADGPSEQAVTVNDMIVERFRRICERRGRKCAVLMMPDVDSLWVYRHSGRNILETIYGGFARKIPVWDPLETLVDATRDTGVCHVFGQDRNCHGHFNRDGYALIAKLVRQRARALDPAP